MHVRSTFTSPHTELKQFISLFESVDAFGSPPSGSVVAFTTAEPQRSVSLRRALGRVLGGFDAFLSFPSCLIRSWNWSLSIDKCFYLVCSPARQVGANCGERVYKIPFKECDQVLVNTLS